MIQQGEEILVGNGRRLRVLSVVPFGEADEYRVLAVVPFGEEDESRLVGMLRLRLPVA
jgi:hypothetical protein